MPRKKNQALRRSRRSKNSFQELKKVVQTLLGPKGCPWDKQQTHKSLRPYLIEEAYEVIEAINRQDFEALKDELGDLLLQVYLHAEIARREGQFNVEEVAETIAAKMVRRHPHVFSAQARPGTSVSQVWQKWEKIKAEEARAKAKKTGKRLAAAESMLEKVPRALPSLYRASLVQKRAARAGFEWTGVTGALRQGSKEKLEEEIGDLFFALVNVARKLDLDPEETLHAAIDKFTRRFRKIEAGLRKNPNMQLDQMDRIWKEVKRREK